MQYYQFSLYLWLLQMKGEKLTSCVQIEQVRSLEFGMINK